MLFLTRNQQCQRSEGNFIVSQIRTSILDFILTCIILHTMQGILFYNFILVSVYSDCVIFYGDTDITVYACSCMQCNSKQRTVSVSVCVCVCV